MGNCSKFYITAALSLFARNVTRLTSFLAVYIRASRDSPSIVRHKSFCQSSEVTGELLACQVQRRFLLLQQEKICLKFLDYRANSGCSHALVLLSYGTHLPHSWKIPRMAMLSVQSCFLKRVYLIENCHIRFVLNQYLCDLRPVFLTGHM